MSWARRIVVQSTAVVLCLFGHQAYAQPTLSDENVLVVYNSAIDEASGGGGQIIFNYYKGLKDREGVVGLDLNDPTLLPGNISYAEFITKVLNPIRAFLIGNDLTEQILVITLTRGIPFRVADLSETGPINPGVAKLLGDRPDDVSDFFDAQNLTCASVDSELALLFQDLEAGEAGGAFDSPADNYIRNPFFNSTQSIAASDRSLVQEARTFAESGSIQVLRGRLGIGTLPTDTRPLFLTARLDGDSVSDVVAALQRAQNPVINPSTDRFIIDEFDPADGGPSQGEEDELDALGLSAAVRTIDPGGDFDQLALDLTNAGFAGVDFDEGTPFLIGANGTVTDPGATPISGPVAAVFTLGGNHSTIDQNNYLKTFIDDETGESQLVAGAYFTSIESFSARAFGGLTEFTDQGSVAEFIAVGGTFGVGTVFEPFTLGINEVDILIDRHFNASFTFVEAAFASIPFVSSQSIVIGDPLAKVTLGPRPVPLEEGVVRQAVPAIQFQTELGVNYLVFKSTDGTSFTVFRQIMGTGLVESVIDNELQSGNSAIYRVEAQ